MNLGSQQQLKDDGAEVDPVELCRWFEAPEPKVCYSPIKTEPKPQNRFATSINAII